MNYPFFRLPRFWRDSFRPFQFLMAGFRLQHLASQFIKSKALASDSERSLNESVGIGCFASVESKALFVQVSKKVKRFYRNVSAFDRAFQKRPKGFNPVS